METIIKQIEPLQTTVPPKFASAASLTFLLYDNFLTLDREISTVWQADWSTGKIIFLLNRYVVLFLCLTGFIAQVSPNPGKTYCRAWYSIESFVSIFCLSVVQIILLLRTYALYKRSKVVLAFLSFLCISCSLTMVVIAAIFTPRLFFHDNPIPFILQFTGGLSEGYGEVGLGCLKDCHHCSGLLQAFYVPMLVFDIAVFLLTLASAVQHSRDNVRAPLLFMLYRDGFIYFAVILVTSLSNIMLWFLLEGGLIELLPSIVRSMLSVMCSRLMLNIRSNDYQHRRRHGITSMSLATYQLEEINDVASAPQALGKSPDGVDTETFTSAPSDASQRQTGRPSNDFRAVWMRGESPITPSDAGLIGTRNSKLHTSNNLSSRSVLRDTPSPTEVYSPEPSTSHSGRTDQALLPRSPAKSLQIIPTTPPATVLVSVRRSTSNPGQGSSNIYTVAKDARWRTDSFKQGEKGSTFLPRRPRPPDIDIERAGYGSNELGGDDEDAERMSDDRRANAPSTQRDYPHVDKAPLEGEDDRGRQRRLEWQREWDWDWKIRPG